MNRRIEFDVIAPLHGSSTHHASIQVLTTFGWDRATSERLHFPPI